jgi:hypothetical protein
MKTHNPKRFGEVYDINFISQQIKELELIKPWITLSGGWAWHFISPLHTEYKHLHDHTDIDIFVLPIDFLKVQLTLEDNGWKRMKTKYDNNTFIRYEKHMDRKMVIDLFKGEIPNIEVKGWKVAEPNYLLSLYKTVHQSDNCIAVQRSLKLQKKGISPIDNELLIDLNSK